jgi:hypothetical protein
MEKEGNSKGLLIIVSLIVLVVIVVGVFIFIGEEKTPAPDPVSEQCKFACDSGQKMSFCDIERELTDGSRTTCDALAKENKLSVETCPKVSCAEETLLDTTCVSGLGSIWKAPTSGDKCPSEENKFVRKRTSSDSAPVSGQICCYYYE